jgi:hypothetical protein
MPRRVYPLPQSGGTGRHQEGGNYCSRSCSRLGSSRSENGKLNNQDIGPILEEVQTKQCLEWTDFAYRAQNGKTLLNAVSLTKDTGSNGNLSL